MKKALSILLLTSLFIIIGCKKDKKETTTEIEKVTIKAKKLKLRLEPKSDSNVTGKVVFNEENDGVRMVAIMEGLTPGSHAIHIHKTADCSSADGKSTGGHWNPTAKPHGQWGAPEGYHKGDIGNFTADEKGRGIIEFTTNEWCIGCGDPAKDIIGKAIIVHQGTDDYKTQPTGAAGGRVSCGGIIE